MGRDLRSYARWQFRRVPGWFTRINAEVFSTLLTDQINRDLTGGVVEIGVHHGRSFLLLSLAAQEHERALAIDVFEEQHLNLDMSGKGDLQRFQRNLQKYGNPERVDVLAASSLDITADQITAHVGPVRFFSIDGGHSLDVTLNDLNLAAATIAPHGVIALDDFTSPGWPEVAVAFIQWYRGGEAEFAPFAITRGKIYVCRRGWEKGYQAALSANQYLALNKKKTTELLGNKMDVFTGVAGGPMTWLRLSLKMRTPRIWRILKLMKSLAKSKLRHG